MIIDWNQNHRRTFVLAAMFAWLVGAAPHAWSWAQTGLPPDALVWNMTHYHVSYQEFGFLRRGLVGTLLSPIFVPLPDGGAVEYAILLGLDILLCLGLAIAAARLFLPTGSTVPGQALLAAAILIGPVGMIQMGFDVGRLDHVNFCLVALAAASVLQNRIRTAAILMTLAMLVHEAVLFYGVPPVMALAWQKRRALSDVIIIGLPVLATAAALALWGGAETDLATALPANVNLAASVWARGILEPARGFPPTHYVIAAYMACVPLFLLYRHYRLNATSLDLLFAATTGGLTLFLLGVDYGRWSHCIFFAVLVAIAAGPMLGRRRGTDLGPLHAKIVVVPWLLPLGPLGIAILYPFIPWII